MDLIAPDAPVFLPRSKRYIVAVDLGQSSDPTAISILEHEIGVLDSNSAYERHCGIGDKPQVKADRINVKHLERLKLGLSYPVMIDYIIDLLGRAPLCGDGNKIRPAELVVDDSGVGRPVSDLMLDRGLRPIRVTITSGLEVKAVGLDRWHVSKTQLISTVDAMLNDGRLRFAAALSEAPAMKDELRDFQRKLSAAGQSSYSARSGQHDDLVLSVAIGCWFISLPPHPVPVFSHY